MGGQNMGTITVNAETIERQDAHHLIDDLPDSAMSKLVEYINYLRYQERMEALEDAEDIADAEARRDEPTVPHSVIIADYEAKYGPLD